MYIKEYIFRMKMSQRIHFCYQISLKIMIFFLRKIAKITFFGKKKDSWTKVTTYKKQFLVKNAEIA